ncbi:UPL3 [Symbiodinium pilosum]|uniref:UPL3 protein n=1 Tax=Symbiodinium pilosum TaxID=2952 RepID=A0A812RTM1_SYMPI|nr:UPL3 [Symbiodinium pilosum]
MARRSLTLQHSGGILSPTAKTDAEELIGSSLKKLRPITSIRPPRSRPVAWVDRRQHVSEVRTAQMDLGWDMEGHMPDLSYAAPGFLSQAHLRSEEYWKDLLGIDDENIAAFHFIQSDFCGKFMAACIIVFVLVVGHHDTDELPKWGAELVHGILAISLIEVTLHICNHYQGAQYKKPEDRTILTLDTIAVVVSCCEIWIFPVVVGPSLHFSRMVWLIRFLRVISMIPSLRELTLGVLDALQGLFWVLMFLFIFVYALAVVLTRMIGHRERSKDPDVQEVQDMFSNVGNSMFYLFQLTSQWSLVPLFPLLKASPATCVGFTLFYIYSGWVIVAVMTGTVSFTMISFKARMVQEDELREEEKRVFVKQVLEDIFLALDEDGNGELSYEEFQALLRSKEVLLLLSDNTDIKIQDLEDMWQWIDTDKSGSVTIAEFFEGFEMLNEPFRQKTLLKVQERVSGEIQITQKRLRELAMESLDVCCHNIYTPMNKIHAVLEQVQIQLLTALRLKHQVGLVPVNSQTEEDATLAEVLIGAGLQVPEVANSLASIEARLEMQMLEAVERINNFRAVKTQRQLRWSQTSSALF